MRDIQVTRKATHSITLAIKFFLVKKQYYLTMLKIKPEIYKHSEFIKLLKNKDPPTSPMMEMSRRRSHALGITVDEDNYHGNRHRRKIEILQYIQMNNAYKIL